MLKRVFQENKERQIFRKTNISYPLIRTIYNVIEWRIYLICISRKGQITCNFFTPCSWVIKSIESVVFIYSSTHCSMEGNLKEILLSLKTSSVVFAEVFLTMHRYKSLKSRDIDVKFYLCKINNKKHFW